MTGSIPPTSLAVLLEREGAIARIRFNRPDVLNAADRPLALAFRDACRAIAADASVRVVVISGAGRAFMAGGDIAQFRDPASIPESLIDPLHEGLLCLSRLQAPVIASLHGPVAGAGLSIAMGCDLAIAADTTRFNFAYTNLATSCDLGASWHLPRLVGLRRALEIALLCEPLDAQQALKLGLVNRVEPAKSLEAATHHLALRLAAGAPVAQGQVKRLLRDAWSRELPAQLAAERAAFAHCAGTHDFAEGVSAFLGKRAPVFQGR
jgi:2-(1,2-epoxy-1,2-dihydrophenyl)acetyl-CoA isomerase